jgi:hypothetical protein
MRTITVVLLVVLAAVAGSCGGSSSPTAPSVETLAGTWRATRAEFASAANASLKVEVISLGATLVLVLDQAGTFTQTFTPPGNPPEVTTGTWSASRDVLTLRRGASSNSQFDMTLSGSTLTLTGGSALFDVNGDDVDEEAKLSVTLVRQ